LTSQRKNNKTLIYNGDSEQINGREGETATLLKRSLVYLTLRGGGFAPRHFNRSASKVCAYGRNNKKPM
jgi:hypothetical protein